MASPTSVIEGQNETFSFVRGIPASAEIPESVMNARNARLRSVSGNPRSSEMCLSPTRKSLCQLVAALSKPKARRVSGNFLKAFIPFTEILAIPDSPRSVKHESLSSDCKPSSVTEVELTSSFSIGRPSRALKKASPRPRQLTSRSRRDATPRSAANRVILVQKARFSFSKAGLRAR